MDRQIFFNSSLPRSGSTLLSNIIAQREDFYVTPTSGVLELLYAARINFTNGIEFKAQDNDMMLSAFKSFCVNGLNGFFDPLAKDRKYVLDKSRGWGAHYGFLSSFYKDPKILCMVRDIRSILTSMEKKFRANQMIDSGIINYGNMVGTTTEKRCEIWLNTPPVGLSIERLEQMFLDGTYKNILFIKYDNLCKDPKKTMTEIYKWLGIDDFKHDFNNIVQTTKEDDSLYGIYGDHKIRRVIEPSDETEYQRILPNSVNNYVINRYRWFYDNFSYI